MTDNGALDAPPSAPSPQASGDVAPSAPIAAAGQPAGADTGTAPAARADGDTAPAGTTTAADPAATADQGATAGPAAGDTGDTGDTGTTATGTRDRTTGDGQAAKATPAADADLPVLARIHGEPLRRIPNDLYIPPDALEVLLDTFEGPLDLLLYLIRKQNFDILDIPMAKVTTQYLAYVDEIRSRNLELAAEYLLMAAMLIDIKSRMLLPVKKADSDEEVEDPRAELARRLLEYERIKYGAAQIDALPVIGRDFIRSQVHLDHTAEVRLPDVSPDDLRAAWADVLRRARLVQRHQVQRESLSVREHMSVILRKLQTRRFAEFHELFEVGQGAPTVIVTFVAMLELARENLLQITQAEAFAPIYVRLSYLPS